MKVHPLQDQLFAAADTTKNKSSGSAFGNVLEEAKGMGKLTPAEELAAYVKMTPAQRMAADLLKQMGLTQADLDAMPPAERQAIVDKIAAIVKRQMELQSHAKKVPGAPPL